MLKSKNKMMSLAISALMLGATAGAVNSMSEPVSVSAAVTTWGGYYTPTYIKCKSGLNVRTGPGTNYKKITAIPWGTWVTTTRLSSNGWAKVSYNGKTGWIYLNNGIYAELYLD